MPDKFLHFLVYNHVIVFVCACVHVCMCACVHVCMCAHVRMCTCVYIAVNVHMHVPVLLCLCMRLCACDMHVHFCLYVRLRAYVCEYAFACAHVSERLRVYVWASTRLRVHVCQSDCAPRAIINYKKRTADRQSRQRHHLNPDRTDQCAIDYCDKVTRTKRY